jgi:hypothetical protein
VARARRQACNSLEYLTKLRHCTSELSLGLAQRAGLGWSTTQQLGTLCVQRGGSAAICPQHTSAVFGVTCHETDQFKLGTYVELAIDGFEVVAHCVGAYHQVLSDVLDATPGTQGLNNFFLT